MGVSRTIAWSVLTALIASSAISTSSCAETAWVRVVFSKAGFVAGIGSGNGILTFHGKRYPFKVSGASLGATVGISTNPLIGRALNLQKPEDLAGTYTAVGAGAAVGARVRVFGWRIPTA
jgi:hypothetical protein